MEFIREVSRVCTVSLGHTTADYDTAAAAFEAGATHATHLFNGMPDGEYELGCQPIEMKNGRATLLGTDTLAGSSTNLLTEVRNLVSFGFALEDAIYAVTEAPARAVRLEQHIGSIAVGKQADLLLLSKDLELEAVFVDGVRI